MYGPTSCQRAAPSSPAREASTPGSFALRTTRGYENTATSRRTARSADVGRHGDALFEVARWATTPRVTALATINASATTEILCLTGPSKLVKVGRAPLAPVTDQPVRRVSAQLTTRGGDCTATRSQRTPSDTTAVPIKGGARRSLENQRRATTDTSSFGIPTTQTRVRLATSASTDESWPSYWAAHSRRPSTSTTAMAARTTTALRTCSCSSPPNTPLARASAISSSTPARCWTATTTCRQRFSDQRWARASEALASRHQRPRSFRSPPPLAAGALRERAPPQIKRAQLAGVVSARSTTPPPRRGEGAPK